MSLRFRLDGLTGKRTWPPEHQRRCQKKESKKGKRKKDLASGASAWIVHMSSAPKVSVTTYVFFHFMYLRCHSTHTYTHIQYVQTHAQTQTHTHMNIHKSSPPCMVDKNTEHNHTPTYTYVTQHNHTPSYTHTHTSLSTITHLLSKEGERKVAPCDSWITRGWSSSPHELAVVNEAITYTHTRTLFSTITHLHTHIHVHYSAQSSSLTHIHT